MARRRRRRDNSTIATDPVSRFVGPSPVTFNYNTLTDRRTFHPDGPYRPVLSFDDTPATITLESNTNVRQTRRQARRNDPVAQSRSPQRLVFAERPRADGKSSGIPLCVRRETRREVLFAKGKGGSPHKRKVRRTLTSKIGC